MTIDSDVSTKKALVLSGGGSKGAVQVGMAMRLFQEGFKPDFVAGVSVGALNGFFLAQHKPDLLYNLWKNIKSSDDVYRSRWLTLGLGLIGWQWGYPSIYKPGPIKKLIRKHVKATKPEDFKAEFRCGTVNLRDGEYVVAHQGSDYLGRMMAGSMSIPIVFPPVPVCERRSFLGFLRRTEPKPVDGCDLFVDGCVRANSPISDAIDYGADEIHVLQTGGTTLHRMDGDFMSFIDIISRTIEIMLHQKLVDDIKGVLVRNDLAAATEGSVYRHVKLYVYEPEDAVTQGCLDFDQQAIQECIDLGYELGRYPKDNNQLASWFGT